MRATRTFRPSGPRSEVEALTLLELLVVVAILAVLTTVAVRSTSELGSEVRYDSTQRTLQVFRNGVLGPANQMAPDGTPFTTGFVADMGRPPRSTLTLHPTYGSIPDISELYSGTLPGSLKAYSLYPASSANTATLDLNTISTPALRFDPSLRVAAGWRGPYVMKLSSLTTLQDGWGKALVSRTDLGSSLSAINQWPTMLLTYRTTEDFTLPDNSAYTAVTTPGKDVTGWFTMSGFEGAPSSTGDPYSGRFYSVISTNEYQIPITVTVTCASNFSNFSSSNWLLLMMYGPNPDVATDSTLRPLLCTSSQLTYNNGFSYSFPLTGPGAPTIGTRVFRAILHHTTSNQYSRVVYFPIRPGVQNINIALP